MERRGRRPRPASARPSTGCSAWSRCPSPARRPPPAPGGRPRRSRPTRRPPRCRPRVAPSSRPTPTTAPCGPRPPAERLPVRLHPSVWVPAPVATRAARRTALWATAAALASPPALVAFHHLVVTAVGLVPAGRADRRGRARRRRDCVDPSLDRPGATPTVVPPRRRSTALVTVTNCGNVPESDVTVTRDRDPGRPGRATAAAAGRARGGRTPGRRRCDRPGRRRPHPALAPLPVAAAGTRYSVDGGRGAPARARPTRPGSTQQFLVQVAPADRPGRRVGRPGWSATRVSI